MICSEGSLSWLISSKSHMSTTCLPGSSVFPTLPLLEFLLLVVLCLLYFHILPPKGLHCLSFVLVAGSFDSGSVASVFPVPFPEFVCCIDSGMRFLLGFLKNSVIVLHPVALLSHPWVLLIFQRKHLLLSIPQDHTEVGNRK